MYKIADYHGEELEGTFYKQELQSIIKKDSDFYTIENVIKSRMRGKRREYLVKWLGYSKDFNSWVPEDNVKDISKEICVYLTYCVHLCFALRYGHTVFLNSSKQ